MNYSIYREKMRQIADVNYALALMFWDMETQMPSKGAGIRAQQIGTVSGVVHKMFVNDEMCSLLKKLLEDKNLSEKQRKNIELTFKDFNKKKKYPAEFVETISKTTSEASVIWEKARKQKDFKLFQPHLEKIIELKRQECELLGYDDHPYNALLDNFEPDAKVKDLDVLFADVRKQMVEFVQMIASQSAIDNSFLKTIYSHQKQWDFGIDMLKQMGYDFEAGRQDLSAHPFTRNFNSCDVRITTRINENDFTSMLWSCIHEGGHALYEQGLDAEEYGLPSGHSISLGIHESQSRLWENHVGRSLSYWKANYGTLQKYFPQNLSNISLKEFYNSINRISPSLIRVEADELTYHSHILIRYEIEKGLMEGNIKVKDLPEIWNQKYKEYLDIEVPNDGVGVLQDVHWSHGLIGYFPTYSLGSFYAAQFFAKACEELPELEKNISSGNMMPLLNWLREKIHKHGRLYKAEELCKKITGKKLEFSYFMAYVEKKYNKIYNLSVPVS